MRFVVFCLCALAGLSAADAAALNPAGHGAATDPDALDRGDPPKPGQASPASAVAACAIRFDWGEVGEDYVSVVVIGDGIGIVRPAWVATWKRGAPPAGDVLQVAYRATAFRDVRGRIHIDARHAEVNGPERERWSPDSFAFGHRKLWTCDDREDGHAADVGEFIPAEIRGDEYRQLLHLVQSLAEGGL